MGNCNCNPFGINRNRSSRKSPRKIVLLLVGLDNSGKTSAAKSLIGESVDTVVPTVGFSVISLLHRGFSVMIYDLGGGPQIRDIWHRYFTDVHGVIFVIDASDVSRLGEGKEVLTKLLGNEKVAGKPVLVLANKQDRDGALDELDIVERFDLDALVNRHKCRTLVETCSTTQGKKRHLDPAIHNGYVWLMKSIIDDYGDLNARVESDMARQKELDDADRKERRERVARLRAERGETEGEGETAHDDEFSASPFQPIDRLAGAKVLPLDPSLDTRVILVGETWENREASIELRLNQEAADDRVILVRESPRRINNVRPPSGGRDRVTVLKSVERAATPVDSVESGVILVRESPHSAKHTGGGNKTPVDSVVTSHSAKHAGGGNKTPVESSHRAMDAGGGGRVGEKAAPATTQDPPARRDPFLVPAPAVDSDKLSNGGNVSITEFVKDQLELERVHAQRKKRVPLRRANKTAPASLSPEPIASRENGLGPMSPSRSNKSPSSPLKKPTQLPPLKSVNHTIEGHWTLPPLTPNPDLSWAIVTAADTKVETATNHDHKDESENTIKG